MKSVVHIVGCIACLGYLSAAVGGGPGAVLCIGSDGHAGVERTIDGISCSSACTADPGRPAPRSGSAYTDGDPCVSCVDVPLLSPARMAGPAKLQRHAPSGDSHVPALAAGPPVAFVASAPALAEGVPYSAFSAACQLRSTVLLI